MAEYIRREDAIKCIEGQCVDGKMWGNDESEGTLIEAYSAIDDLMEIPSADVAPVRHGRWEDCRCSNCKEEAMSTSWDEPVYDYDWEENLRYSHTETHTEYHLTNYCPNCGAKMDLEG